MEEVLPQDTTRQLTAGKVRCSVVSCMDAINPMIGYVIIAAISHQDANWDNRIAVIIV